MPTGSLPAQRYLVEFEIATGPNAPFRRKEIELDHPLNIDRLYLATPRPGASVELLDLVILSAAPAAANYSCCFFNRVEGDEARMVSYQYSDEPKFRRPVDSLQSLFAAVDGSMSRPKNRSAAARLRREVPRPAARVRLACGGASVGGLRLPQSTRRQSGRCVSILAH